MTRRNAKSGTINIPRKEWVGLKRVVREAYNSLFTYAEAVRALDALKKEKITTRSKYERMTRAQRERLKIVYDLPLELLDRRIERVLYSEKTGRLAVPLMRSFPRATTSTHTFDLGDVLISFNNPRHELRYRVTNERAWENPVVVAMFKKLEAIARRNDR